LRAIPEKEEAKSETEEEDKGKKVEARPEDDEKHESRRDMVESLRILLVT